VFKVHWCQSVLEIALGGFWTDAEFAAYEASLRRALEDAPAGGFTLLANLSDMTTQSSEIVARQIAATDQIKAAGATAIAVVLGSALLKRQVERAVGRSVPCVMFESEPAAREWLTAAAKTGLA
jgi:ABC-type sugar transport system substrate-binding protein